MQFPQHELRAVWSLRNFPPTHWLPPVARDAVLEAQDKLNATPELAIFCALAAMTVASQANVDVQRPGGGAMPTSLMLVFTGESATGKSLAFRHFLGPAQDMEAEYDRAYAAAREEHSIRLKLWNGELRKLVATQEKFRLRGQIDRAERLAPLLTRLRESRPIAPRMPKFSTNDATLAGLLRAQERWPWLAVQSTEGSTVYESDLFERQGHVNLLLDGEPASRDRAYALQRVPDGRVSFIIVSHPATQASHVKRLGPAAVENGFLPRADFFFPDPSSNKIGYRRIDTVEPELPWLEAFKIRFRQRLQLGLPEKIAGTFKRKLLRLSPVAERRWHEYAKDDIEMQLRPGAKYSAIPAAASKSIEKVLRIAASLHDFSDNPDDVIAESEINCAIYIARWCLDEWLRIMGPRPEESEEMQCAREIFATLQAHLAWGRVDLVEQSFLQPRVRGHARKQPYFQMGLDVLEQLNVIRREVYMGKRRPRVWLRLNRGALIGN